jgi:DNA-binding MarR family transcriptional regulator
MLSRQKKLPEEELMLVRNLLGALEPFFQLKGTLPTRCIQAFLLVAEEEGLSVNEYARRANMSMSTMSRNLLDIGERNRHMEKGFGLVASRNNPMNLREKEYYLTDTGRALLHSITRQLKKRG